VNRFEYEQLKKHAQSLTKEEEAEAMEWLRTHDFNVDPMPEYFTNNISYKSN
jgi:hypothetical protein